MVGSGGGGIGSDEGGGGGCSGGGSKEPTLAGLTGAKGSGSKGKILGCAESLTNFFCNLSLGFRFENEIGRTLALQSFRITHLINAEILANLVRNKIKWKKIHFNVISYLL